LGYSWNRYTIHHFRFIRFEKATLYLLAVRSDFYVYTADENLRINPQSEAKKKSDVVKIKLDPKYYGKIDGLDKRFSDGIHSLVDCDSLIIGGDVRFEKDVTIKCSVCIKNRQGSQAVIKAGTVIDQDLIFKKGLSDFPIPRHSAIPT
jgi:UTP--glucose-1-phosphate uridylyltransferase